MAAGCLGATLVLADWRLPTGKSDSAEASNWEFRGSRTITVDGEKIKEFTFYSFRDGNLVEIDISDLPDWQKLLVWEPEEGELKDEP